MAQPHHPLDSIDIPTDGPGLAATLAAVNRLQARVAAAVGAFDASGDWALDGSTSPIAWLRGHGLASGDAATLVKTGRRLRALPALGDAWAAGRLSAGQVRAVLGNIRDAHVAAFAEHEAELVPLLEDLDVAGTQVAMTQWRLRAEALDDHRLGDEHKCEAHLSQTLDGRWYLNGAFDAESGAVIDTAIRLANSGDWNRVPAERRGDALVDVCRWFLDNQHTNTGRRHRPHLNVVVDGDSLTGHGHVTGRLAEQQIPLDTATITRLLCDCALHRVLRDADGTIIDYGRSTRTIPAPLFNALVVRDRHCRFPNCDRPPTWCEGHHVHWYSNGGPTNPDNLVLLCARHHHKLHSRGWHAWLEPDGTLVVTNEITGFRGHTVPELQRKPLAS